MRDHIRVLKLKLLQWQVWVMLNPIDLNVNIVADGTPVSVIWLAVLVLTVVLKNIILKIVLRGLRKKNFRVLDRVILPVEVDHREILEVELVVKV